MATSDPYPARVAALHEQLTGLPDLLVAVSGGVDSACLLHAAYHALGPRATGWIGDSPSLPRQDLAEARTLAATIGAHLEIHPTAELDDPDYRANAGRRCYFCRRELFQRMRAWAIEHGFTHLAYGEITDDAADDRPGRAAARELSVVAPLVTAGFTKEDVRRYAREHALPVADKPASACLASRIPVGTEVTSERLGRIERAEELVRGMGFRIVRVRDHGRRARLEVGADELEHARQRVALLSDALSTFGFEELHVAAYHRPR